MSERFISLTAQIGVRLLLLALGLEYSGDELRRGLRTGARSGVADAALNFAPGFACGMLLGWDVTAAVLLRAGAALVARGEFSIVIASLGAATADADDLSAVASAFVLVTAIASPLLAKLVDRSGRPARA